MRTDDAMLATTPLPGRVISTGPEMTKVAKGASIANVELDVAGQRLVASITVEAVEELGIGPGSEVTVIVKASDVMLAVDD